MTDVTTRLRARVDQLTQERDEAREALARAISVPIPVDETAAGLRAINSELRRQVGRLQESREKWRLRAFAAENLRDPRLARQRQKWQARRRNSTAQGRSDHGGQSAPLGGR